MDQSEIIKATEEYVKNKLAATEKGHDWNHIARVRNLSMLIAQTESGNKHIIELGALLHDIADPKFNQGDSTEGPMLASAFLHTIGLNQYIIDEVVHIIKHVSFKGGIRSNDFTLSPELAIVQDADRLDAMGAIGIARAFHYGGYKNREMYNPAITPKTYQTEEEYRKNQGTTLNHFYEKLFVLKDLMNTPSAKKMAEDRHKFMQNFVQQFLYEWNFGSAL